MKMYLKVKSAESLCNTYSDDFRPVVFELHELDTTLKPKCELDVPMMHLRSENETVSNSHSKGVAWIGKMWK